MDNYCTLSSVSIITILSICHQSGHFFSIIIIIITMTMLLLFKHQVFHSKHPIIITRNGRHICHHKYSYFLKPTTLGWSSHLVVCAKKSMKWKFKHVMVWFLCFLTNRKFILISLKPELFDKADSLIGVCKEVNYNWIVNQFYY